MLKPLVTPFSVKTYQVFCYITGLYLIVGLVNVLYTLSESRLPEHFYEYVQFVPPLLYVASYWSLILVSTGLSQPAWIVCMFWVWWIWILAFSFIPFLTGIDIKQPVFMFINGIVAIGCLSAVLSVRDRFMTKYFKLLGISYFLVGIVGMLGSSIGGKFTNLRIILQLLPILCMLILVIKARIQRERQLAEEALMEDFLKTTPTGN